MDFPSENIIINTHISYFKILVSEKKPKTNHDVGKKGQKAEWKTERDMFS